MKRRAFLGTMLLPFAARAAKVDYPVVVPGKSLEFPRDHGAHPAHRIEWWYVTGWLGDAMGFQVTFFRARPEEQSDNPSSFNPRQVLFAHAALSDPARGRLVHAENAARAGLSLAGFERERTGVWIDDWRLEQQGERYVCRIPANDLDFRLNFENRRKPVLRGENGFSQKGHRPHEASYYYSRPHLEVSGTVNGRTVEGKAWLDHEWSSAVMAPEAAGWDWCGINLGDGGSLMAFRMRDKAGGLHYAPPGISLRPLRYWTSPRTGVSYPVSMEVNGLRLEPLMDDQELDSRASTGTIYWEGAVRAYRGGAEVGRGYLELTGYWRPMRL
ncbi:MAG TPA: lipocalin-like domain-containing protein [Burkholderiales bacterium]|nr:lipocalin-like domain-containing protein [Burkholderiales bacterium]